MGKSPQIIRHHFKNKKEKMKWYRHWVGMQQRCDYSGSISYKYYGARGIKVCDRWRNNIDNFLDDVLPSYQPGLTLERINNDGDYGPDNFRWATPQEQAYNRRSNRLIEIDGSVKPLGRWCEELGLKRSTVSQRINAYNWSIKRAFELEG